ncbi:MAG TPA: twin-arginine translocase TatA/TatE family subunit [Desulfobaccales bacterium]
MGIDFETLIILAVLAFILFGPEKLPEYAAKLGYYVGKLRAASSELTEQYQSSLNLMQNPPAKPPAPPAASGSNPYPALAAQAGVYERPCPMCGQLVAHDFTFCPKCGQRLKAEAEPQTASQSLAS